jgi:micrococcal nuclease
MKPALYTYAIKPLRVIDGDTIVCNIDLGFKVHLLDIHVRVYGVNTPEMHGDKAVEAADAKAFSDAWIKDDKAEFFVRVAERPDKYGRVLGSITKTVGDETFILANDLISNKKGVSYLGGARKDIGES